MWPRPLPPLVTPAPCPPAWPCPRPASTRPPPVLTWGQSPLPPPHSHPLFCVPDTLCPGESRRCRCPTSRQTPRGPSAPPASTGTGPGAGSASGPTPGPPGSSRRDSVQDQGLPLDQTQVNLLNWAKHDADCNLMKINDLFLEKFWAKNEPKPELGSMKNYPQDKDLSLSNVNFETLCFARKFRSIARTFSFILENWAVRDVASLTSLALVKFF